MKKNISRRDTKQKRVILEELGKVKTHPTADSVFKMVRKEMPTVSFGTIYRNLSLLKNEGKILELTCGKYSSRYDGDTNPHYHLFCLDCKGVFDIESPTLKGLDKEMSNETGFIIKYHRINFYGQCKQCKS